MKMYIYPKYLEKASKHHWTVRLLYAFGVIQIVGCTLLGWLFSGSIAQTLYSGGVDAGAVAGLVNVLGLLVGLMAGIISSVGTWILALVVDDIHALRIHSGAYVAYETDSIRMGE